MYGIDAFCKPYTFGLGIKGLKLQTGEAHEYKRRVVLGRDQALSVGGDTVYAQLCQASVPAPAELAGSVSILAKQDDVAFTNEAYWPVVLVGRLGVADAIARPVFRGRR
jgi:hypothetical protein